MEERSYMINKIIAITTALIATLTIVAAGSGRFWNGLYKNDTKSGATRPAHLG
jgi:hypothetical protein